MKLRHALVLTLIAAACFAGSVRAQEVTADEAFGLQPETDATIAATVPEADETSGALMPVGLQATLVPDPSAQEFRIRFSWALNDSFASQSAYQVLLASVGNYIDDAIGDVWDSGRVASEETTILVGESQTFIRALPAGFYFWKVRVWDAAGTRTEYSPAQRFFFIRRESLSPTAVPAAPLQGIGVAISPTEIRWEFTDRADNETGFALLNDRGELILTTAPDVVSDYFYLIERGLRPNTVYTGRMVRAFNQFGLSATSERYGETYTRANTPGPLSAIRLSEEAVRIVIDPNGNPEGTQFALFDILRGNYVDAVGGASDAAVWRTLTQWQETVFSLRAAPYEFTVQAKNGDGIPTAFSPAVRVEATAVSPITLSLSADLLHGGAVLGAFTSYTSARRILGAIGSAGPSVALSLAFAAAIALAYLIHRRERGFHGIVETMLRLLRHSPHSVFETHMDKRRISRDRFHFAHRFGAACGSVAIVIIVVSAASSFAAEHIGEGKTAAPATVSETLAARDVLRVRLDWAAPEEPSGSVRSFQPEFTVTMPPQLAIMDNSIQSSKSDVHRYGTSMGFIASFDEARSAERGSFVFLVEPRPVSEFGGSRAAITASVRTDAASTDATPLSYTLAGTEDSLIGAVVKLADSPRLWYVRDDATRAYIPSMAVFENNFGTDASIIRVITQTQAGYFPERGTLRYTPGTVIRFEEEGVAYEVTDAQGSLHPLTGEEVSQRALQGRAPVLVPQDQFSAYARRE